jgi:hypothetical protein
MFPRFLATSATAAMLVALFQPGSHAAKPNTTTPVPLNVVVDDSAGMRVTSDGLGAYSDGVDGVGANIDQYGDVIINLQTTNVSYRKVQYSYAEPLDGQALPAILASYLDADRSISPEYSYLSTLRANAADPKLQDLPVSAQSCLEGGFAFTLPDAKKTQYRNSFHRGGTNVDRSAETSYLIATRVDSDTWTLEPAAGCGFPLEGVAQLIETPTVGKFSFKDRGLYHMPMKLTLSRKP